MILSEGMGGKSEQEASFKRASACAQEFRSLFTQIKRRDSYDERMKRKERRKGSEKEINQRPGSNATRKARNKEEKAQ